MLKPFEPLVPVIVEHLYVLLPIIFTWLGAWFKRRSVQRKIVKQAVEQVEDESWEECDRNKKARAVELVTRRTGLFTSMPPAQIGKMVEKALPKVKAQNAHRPVRQDRRSIGVKF
ncbi:hypothetical protein UFOVP650_73 [uncultured Caudovirales phage]|uniref:Uncharacterized protein n=1 Tax=uncultured Caudovirales phage TaxID=2100421 RepID=A0A6J5N874_9CAUD|nr:hypothetical protein UFOVP650_73 [uncultured Caudovirales phage]